MFESKREELASRARFLRRMAVSLSLSAAIIAVGLAVGVVGYHWIAKLDWTDAFLEASMILTGMGAVATLSTTQSKIFAALFALFSGIVFISAVTILVAPLFHRLMHKFHVADEDFKDCE